MSSRKSTRAAYGLFYYGPLVAWLALSLLLATTLGSYNHTVSGIYMMLTLLSPETVPPDVNHMYGLTHVVRRGAYVLEYTVFALLLVRAVQCGEKKLKRHSLLIVAGFGLFFAVAENGVRIFTPGRHGGWDDVILSLANVALSTGLTYLFFRVKSWERNYFAGETDSTHGTVQ
ncbi:MAG: VanZ family protein [Fibrella sp.]|nr:VanZ family protein [Armatimonadota bacterium]